MSGIQQLLLGSGQGAAVAVDPYFYSVTSLLHGDGTNGGQNNTFLDSSSNNFTITRNGNTTQGSFSPFSQTGWSNYFDGSGDYLETPSNAAFTLGSSGDFTVECWVYATATPGNYAAFMTTWSDANTGYPNRWFIGVHDSKIKWYNDAGASAIAASSNIQLNTWLHVAAVRSGSTITLYINGTAIGTQTTSQSYTTQGTVKLGYSGTGGNYFYGYISNARVVKGTAVYTANFTVPTAPLTAITNTSLLTCQANRFLDASSNNFTITRNGDVSVQPFSPFNPITPYSTSAVGGSGYFDGSGDNISIADNANLRFGTSDYTIEGWIYPRTLPAGDAVVVSKDASGQRSWLVALRSVYGLAFFIGGTNQTGTNQIPTNAWTHFAVVRSGTSAAFFINGTRVATFTDSSNYTQTAPVEIGASVPVWNDPNNAYITNVRLVKGTAVYSPSSTTLTVPTAPLTAVSNTQLLCNFTNGAIFDNAAVADYETVGNAQISTSVKKYGTGSLAFDGNGDYLFTPSNQTLAFGTADFTIEFWVYFNAVNTIQVVLDFRPNATASSASPDLYLNSDGTLRWFVSGADRITSGALSASTWYHVAICRVASQTKLFINGTQSGSTYADTTSYLQSGAAFGLNRNNGGSAFYYLNGYIDDLRISNGIGRYPYNFTPPTAEFPNIGGTVTLTADPYFDYTTLLLPGNGTNGAQNNTFLDSSTNAFSITRNGNTTQGTFSPFSQTGWSNYFDGTGDYLTTNATQAIPATGDFTVDGWIWCNSYALGPSIISQGTAGTSGRTVIYITAAGKLALQITSTINEFGSAIPTNQWVYFAITRTGSTVTGYINGSSVGTATNSGSIQNTTLEIGGEWNGDPYRWIGYLSNIRVSNVVRTITAAPTAPFTSDANTVVLTCQSNRFIDASSNAYTITRNGDVSVQAFSPFNPTAAWSAATNGGSGYFDGSGDNLAVASNAAFGFGTGNFTIEFWTYVQSTTNDPYWLDGRSTSTANEAVPVIYINSGNYEYYVSGAARINGGAVPLNQWVHVAVVRNGATTTLYSNGTSVGTWSDSTNYATTALVIGQRKDTANQSLTGYIADFRIVKGTAVYTAAFTPPTAPLTAISGTSLLTNFTNAGIYDATSKNDLETVGNAQISTTQSKFGGSSMYFDGTGDYLAIPSGPNLAFGTGDFTVECWVRFDSTADFPNIFSTGTYNTSQFTLRLSNNTAKFQFYAGNAGTVFVTGTTTVAINTWYHVAVVRYSGTTKLYVNGVSEATDSNAFTYLSSGTAAVGEQIGNADGMQGYIDDLRITKGIARYTSNFTPPTTAFLTL